MPSSSQSSDKPLVGKLLPLMVPGLISVLVAGGSVIANNMMNIRSLDRALAELRVKDYRQHKRTLEHLIQVDRASVQIEMVKSKEIVKEGMEVPLWLEASLENKRERIDMMRSRLENYVEENKHEGK